MDFGKMLADALDTQPSRVSWADQNYSAVDLTAAAEAFLAKVREAERAKQRSGMFTIAGYPTVETLRGGGLDGLMVTVDLVAIGVDPYEIRNLVFHRSDEAFLPERWQAVDGGPYKISLVKVEAPATATDEPYTGPVPYMGEVE